MSQPLKVIIFSHESDIDGLGSIVLGKLAFDDIEYDLSPNVITLEEKFRSLIESKEIYKYDKIYITDLALYNPSLELVSKDPILSKRVLVFDHHRSAINEGCDRFDFTTITETDETGKKKCGTELFYEYLCASGLISKTNALDSFVELTRLEDTWEWKKTGELGESAHDLAILFNGVGIDEYINKMYSKLSNKPDEFSLTKEEQKIVTTKKEEYAALLRSIWSNAEFFKDESNNSLAAVFADYEYRNEIAEHAKKQNIEELKYLIIVALEQGAFGQKSYRSIEEGFDVGKIAEAHGGNGHPSAASVNITEEQKKYALTLKNKSNRESLEYLINSSYKE